MYSRRYILSAVLIICVCAVREDLSVLCGCLFSGCVYRVLLCVCIKGPFYILYIHTHAAVNDTQHALGEHVYILYSLRVLAVGGHAGMDIAHPLLGIIPELIVRRLYISIMT